MHSHGLDIQGNWYIWNAHSIWVLICHGGFRFNPSRVAGSTASLYAQRHVKAMCNPPYGRRICPLSVVSCVWRWWWVWSARGQPLLSTLADTFLHKWRPQFRGGKKNCRPALESIELKHRVCHLRSTQTSPPLLIPHPPLPLPYILLPSPPSLPPCCNPYTERRNTEYISITICLNVWSHLCVEISSAFSFIPSLILPHFTPCSASCISLVCYLSDTKPFCKILFGPNQIIESVVGILLFVYLLIVFSFHEKAKWIANVEMVCSKVNLFLLIKVISKDVRLRSPALINWVKYYNLKYSSCCSSVWICEWKSRFFNNYFLYNLNFQLMECVYAC